MRHTMWALLVIACVLTITSDAFAQRRITVPAGTRILVRTNEPLDARQRAGAIFTGILETNIQAEGAIVVRRGATVHGRITEVRPAGRRSGSSQLEIELTDVIIDGTAYPLVTSSFALRGRGEGASTARNVGRGAGLGALVGVVAGGGRGAAVGTLAGAGVGTVASSGRGEQVTIPSDTLIEFRLGHPVALPVERAR